MRLIKELDKLKDEIEQLNKKEQIHILHLLHKNNVVISYNRSGSFVNLTLVNDNVITEIKEYISSLENIV